MIRKSPPHGASTGHDENPDLDVRPLTPGLMDELGAVFRGSWGRGCWCMYPRLTDAQLRELPGTGSASQRKRDAMTKLARGRAPGLLAFEGDAPVGWIAIAPRSEFGRIEASRATPRVDDIDVWVIPCVTVSKTAAGGRRAHLNSGCGGMPENGAPAVEVPRAGTARTGDDNAYFGTEPYPAARGVRASVNR